MPAPFRDLDGHDAYELLGVPEDATSAEIGKARRRAVRDVHPDHRHGDADAENRTRLINLAHHVLTKERAAYDAFRAGPPPEEPEEPEEILDPWDDADDGVVGDPWAPAATGPATAPPPPPGPPPRVAHIHHYRRRRRPSVVTLAAMAIVVTCLVLLGSIVVAAGKRLGEERDRPRPKRAVPAEFAGKWSGERKYAERGKKPRKVRVTLWRGMELGGLEYPGAGGCSAVLVPVKLVDGRLIVDVREGTGDCRDTTIMVTRVRSRLRVDFRRDGKMDDSTADLKKGK